MEPTSSPATEPGPFAAGRLRPAATLALGRAFTGGSGVVPFHQLFDALARPAEARRTTIEPRPEPAAAPVHRERPPEPGEAGPDTAEETGPADPAPEPAAGSAPDPAAQPPASIDADEAGAPVAATAPAVLRPTDPANSRLASEPGRSHPPPKAPVADAAPLRLATGAGPEDPGLSDPADGRTGEARLTVEPAPVRSAPGAALAPHAALAAQLGRTATARPGEAGPGLSAARFEPTAPAVAGRAAAPALTAAPVTPAGSVDPTPAIGQGHAAPAAAPPPPPLAAQGRTSGGAPAAPVMAGPAAAASGAQGHGEPPEPGVQRAAPKAADQAALRARLVRDQISVHLSRAVRDGLDRIEIRLRPEQLGRVEIRLDLGRDGTATATVTVDRPETLELLRSDPRGLERVLQDAGLKTDAGSLSFNLRGGNDRSEPDAGPTTQASRPGSDAGAGPADPAQPAPWMRDDVIGPGRVDVRA